MTNDNIPFCTLYCQSFACCWPTGPRTIYIYIYIYIYIVYMYREINLNLNLKIETSNVCYNSWPYNYEMLWHLLTIFIVSKLIFLFISFQVSMFIAGNLATSLHLLQVELGGWISESVGSSVNWHPRTTLMDYSHTGNHMYCRCCCSHESIVVDGLWKDEAV